MLCMGPCFLVERALYVWIFCGSVSWWKNKQGWWVPCLSSPIPSCVPATRKTLLYCYSLIKACLGISRCGPCAVSSALYHLLTLPKPSCERPASSTPGLEFVSTQSCSTHPLLPPLSQHFGYFPSTVLFLMTHIHTHQPRDPKLLRAVTFS